jgi:hypothetical protein
MKNIKAIYTGLALSAIMIFAATGCKKEAVTVVDDSTQYTAEALINDADLNYNNATFIEGTETTEYSAENEGMPEVYTLIETDMDDAGFKRGLEKRFFTCLKKLDLTDSQAIRLRKSLRAYEECKAADIKAHREAYAKLLAKTEGLRKEYAAQLKNKKITKAEYEAKMKALKQEFEKGLKYIKTTFAKRLNACYDKFVRAMKEILTERQWKAFVACYK